MKNRREGGGSREGTHRGAEKAGEPRRRKSREGGRAEEAGEPWRRGESFLAEDGRGRGGGEAEAHWEEFGLVSYRPGQIWIVSAN